MGRLTLSTIDRFFHPASPVESPGMARLREKYGWDGVGRYWRLCEIIAGEDQGIFHPRDMRTIRRCISALDMTHAALDEFIAFLRDECGLLTVDEAGWLSTAEIRTSWTRASEKRRRDRESYGRKIGILPTPETDDTFDIGNFHSPDFVVALPFRRKLDTSMFDVFNRK